MVTYARPPKVVSGYCQVESENKENGIVIIYSNYLDAGRLIPDFLVRSLLRDDVRVLVVNIRKRVEGDGTWQSNEY